MDELTKKKILNSPGHSKPVTRRDFLSHGLVAAGGYLTAPSLASMLLAPGFANAAACPPDQAPTDLLPVIIIDMAGGAGLSANFIVGKQMGPLDFMSSYSTLGIPTPPQNLPGSVDTSFGAPMHAGASKILAGMLAQTPDPVARQNTSLVTFCHQAFDDGDLNYFNPIILMTRAGLHGSHYSNGISMLNTTSGGYQPSPIVDLALKPVYVSRGGTLNAALSYGDRVNTVLSNPAARFSLSKALLALTQTQKTKLQAHPIGTQLSALAECAHLKINTLTAGSGGMPNMDPRNDPDFAAVYGLASPQDALYMQATIAFGVLNRLSGPGVIQIAGCDYHDNTQIAGDTKDREIGETIGRLLAIAHRKQKPLLIIGYTDGAVYSNPGTRVWTGDASQKAISFMACYKPTGRHPIVRQQVGAFTNAQAIDRNPFFATNGSMLAYSYLANWLQLSGRMDLFSSVAPPSIFPTANLNEILAYG